VSICLERLRDEIYVSGIELLEDINISWSSS